MSGCVYRTEDNKCKFWSDYGKGIVSYCDPCDCEEKTITNADEIRLMSDEQLANVLASVETGVNTYGDDVFSHWLSWLKAPVEEGNNG